MRSKKQNPYPLGQDILVNEIQRTRFDKKMRRRLRRQRAWAAVKDWLRELWG